MFTTTLCLFNSLRDKGHEADPDQNVSIHVQWGVFIPLEGLSAQGMVLWIIMTLRFSQYEQSASA